MNRTFVRFFISESPPIINLKNHFKEFSTEFPQFTLFKALLESASVPLLELCY